jgi:hypothetical protein
MAQDLVPFEAAGALAEIDPEFLDDLQNMRAGIESGFSVVSVRGKVWRVKFRGEERNVTVDGSPDGDPVPSLEVVVLKVSPHKSKIFYKGGFQEGGKEAPDCFSTTGIAPDPGSRDRQATHCLQCPHNQWGSRVTESGKQGKACADAKRIAITPLNDLHNEMFGGPMLLRVPAASMNELKTYSLQLGQKGYAPAMVATKLRFDINEAYPKILFSAIRKLTPEEVATVKELRADERVERIIAEAVEVTSEENGGDDMTAALDAAPAPAALPAKVTAPAPKPAPKPAAPAAKPAPKVAAAPAPKPAPAPAPKPAPAPATVNALPEIEEPAEEVNDDFDNLISTMFTPGIQG